MCRPGTKTVFEANKQQTLEISCRMVANPSTDLAFSWTFNNSINTMDIPVRFFLRYNDGTNSMDLDMSDAW